MVTPGMGTPGTPGTRPINLDELYGQATANRAQFGNFINRRMPGVGGSFRQFLDRQLPFLQQGFGAQRIGRPNSAPDFQAFLQQGTGPGANNAASFTGGMQGRISQPQLDQVANLLRGGPNAPNLSIGQQAAINTLGGNPIGQFNMGLAPQIQQLAGPARQAFNTLGTRNFDTILAEQGAQPGFQFLPSMQRSGWNWFGNR
jgi:hypothetical protein